MTARTGRLRAAWTGEFMAGVVLPAVVVPTAFNSGVNLLYLLGSFLLAYMVVAVGLGLKNLWAVTGEVDGPWISEEGRPLAIRVRLENPGARTCYHVRLRIDAEGMTEAPLAEVGALPPRSVVPVEARARVPGRGVYPVARYRVESPFPIGFMRTERRYALARPEELTVLPRLLPVDFREAFGSDQTLDNEDLLVHGAAGGSTFHGVRPYLFGDPLKHVHWKASARVGRPLVKEFQRPLQARYYLVLDLDRSQLEGEGPEANLEYLVRLAASLGRHLSGSQALYHLVWWDQGTRVSEAFGASGDLDRARGVLAGLGYHPESRLADMLVDALPAIHPGSRLVFFVPRSPRNLPDGVAAAGYPTKAIFLVRSRKEPEPTLPDLRGETGLAGGVDLYRYSIEDDRLDREGR